MNEKLKYSLYVTLYLIISIGILIGTFFLLKPIRANNVSKEILKRYETVAPNVVSVEAVDFEGPIITEKYKGLDQSGNEVATLYTATSNNTYGSITIVVAVAKDGEIIGIDAANVSQTLLVPEITQSINAFKGNLNDTYDGVAGATIAKGTIIEILNEIKKSHGATEVPEEPKSEIEFIEVTEKGRKYKVSKEATYVGASKGLLSFNVIIDEDKKLVSYEELEYNHSGDNFKETALNFFNSLIGRDITTLTNTELDGSTGATNSGRAILDLLMDLAEFIENEPEDVVVFVEEVAGNRKYRLTKESTSVGASKGLLSFNVIIDNENKLVSYEELEYKHSGDNFKETALKFFDSLIGRDITTLNESDLDGSAGATNSGRAILDLLNELSNFIKDGE